MGELAKLQQQLQQDSESFFGKPIRFAPHAMSAFVETYRTYVLFNTQIHMVSDLDCFLGVVANSPACADILSLKGIDLQNVVENPSPPILSKANTEGSVLRKTVRKTENGDRPRFFLDFPVAVIRVRLDCFCFPY